MALQQTPLGVLPMDTKKLITVKAIPIESKTKSPTARTPRAESKTSKKPIGRSTTPVKEIHISELENATPKSLFTYEIKTVKKERIFEPMKTIIPIERDENSFDDYEVMTTETQNPLFGLYETNVKWLGSIYFLRSYHNIDDAIAGHAHYCECVKVHKFRFAHYPEPST